MPNRCDTWKGVMVEAFACPAQILHGFMKGGVPCSAGSNSVNTVMKFLPNLHG